MLRWKNAHIPDIKARESLMCDKFICYFNAANEPVQIV
jgi:hypothetical protein